MSIKEFLVTGNDRWKDEVCRTTGSTALRAKRNNESGFNTPCTLITWRYATYQQNGNNNHLINNPVETGKTVNLKCGPTYMIKSPQKRAESFYIWLSSFSSVLATISIPSFFQASCSDLRAISSSARGIRVRMATTCVSPPVTAAETAASLLFTSPSISRTASGGAVLFT